MNYRHVGAHLDTLDDGRGLAPGDFVELSDEQAKEPRAAELIETGVLILVDEGEGPTEAAEKLAKEKDVDLSKVAGTGAGGRITQPDVEQYLKNQEEGEGK